jgi:hypothetical protein
MASDGLAHRRPVVSERVYSNLSRAVWLPILPRLALVSKAYRLPSWAAGDPGSELAGARPVCVDHDRLG